MNDIERARARRIEIEDVDAHNRLYDDAQSAISAMGTRDLGEVFTSLAIAMCTLGDAHEISRSNLAKSIAEMLRSLPRKIDDDVRT